MFLNFSFWPFNLTTAITKVLSSRVVHLLKIFMENATKATFMLTRDFCCVTAFAAAAVVATAGDIFTLWIK